MRAARSNSRWISSRLKSVMARKSPLGMGWSVKMTVRVCELYTTGGTTPRRYELEDIPPQVFVLEDLRHPLLDLRSVEHDALDWIVRQLEQHVLEQRGEHGVQPAGADVLHPLVHLGGDARDLLHAVGLELERRAVRLAQRGVLLGERVLRLGHDADEIGFGERA